MRSESPMQLMPLLTRRRGHDEGGREGVVTRVHNTYCLRRRRRRSPPCPASAVHVVKPFFIPAECAAAAGYVGWNSLSKVKEYARHSKPCGSIGFGWFV